MAKEICCECGKVINDNYETGTGEDSHGLCQDCYNEDMAQLNEPEPEQIIYDDDHSGIWSF